MAITTSMTIPNTAEADKIKVFDQNGNAIPFGSLLEQQNIHVKRTLVVFIRHFFCGNCQEYVRRLSQAFAPSIRPADLSIIIIGCGASSHITSYLQTTECPFPLYADHSTQLYKLLGMRRTLSLGPKDPAYIQHSLAAGMMKSIVQGLKRLPSGDIGKAGDLSVNGGEYLFSRQDSTPEWAISWSHCMLNSRDHSEIDTLRLQLNLKGLPTKDRPTTSSTTSTVAPIDSYVCKDNLCDYLPNDMRRSLSSRNSSWSAKAGQLLRSTSVRKSMIRV